MLPPAPLKYLHGYPEHLVHPVRALLADGRLGPLLFSKYPEAHPVRNDGPCTPTSRS